MNPIYFKNVSGELVHDFSMNVQGYIVKICTKSLGSLLFVVL